MQNPEDTPYYPGDYVLPCEVTVAPATRIGKGCTLKTLMNSISLREETDDREIDIEGLRGVLNLPRRSTAAGLAEALRGLVRINEEHNAACEKVLGRPVGWKDEYLDRARAELAAYDAMPNKNGSKKL